MFYSPDRIRSVAGVDLSPTLCAFSHLQVAGVVRIDHFLPNHFVPHLFMHVLAVLVFLCSRFRPRHSQDRIVNCSPSGAYRRLGFIIRLGFCLPACSLLSHFSLHHSYRHALPEKLADFSALADFQAHICSPQLTMQAERREFVTLSTIHSGMRPSPNGLPRTASIQLQPHTGQRPSLR